MVLVFNKTLLHKWKKIGVKFAHACVRVLNLEEKYKGYERNKEFTIRVIRDKFFLSNRLRICRGDKGTLFVLRKINSPTLLKNFEEFIKIY